MHATVTSFDSQRATPLAGSFLLHALVVIGIFFYAAPAQIMPQQFIEITLVAPPASQEVTQQQDISSPEEIAEPVPVEKTHDAPLIKQQAKQQPAPHKKRTPPPQETTAQLKKLSPSAGTQNDAAPAPRVETSAPEFNARYLNNSAPDYPNQAKRRGMQGTVMLGVLVAESGLAKSVQIAKSSGFAMLDKSALETVRQWKFVPAKRGQETIEAHVIVPIEFRLQ